jgi:formate hydrogenlyase subunit 3/multisubunit Na+/H+ antiporter MnhD subunit
MSPVAAVPGDAWMAWAVAVPLAAAAAAFLVGRHAARIGAAASAAVAVPAAGLIVEVWRRGPLQYAVGGWGAPLGIELHADGLGALLVATTAVVCAAVGVYAGRYFRGGPAKDEDSERPRFFWALWLFLWAALNALFLSRDLFNLYVALELITLAAVGLVALAGGADAAAAALRYLIAALLGSLLYLLGVARLYAEYGVLDVAAIGRAAAGAPVPAAAMGLLVAGLLLKGALFPLHVWLPPAHASAPAPVSAVLSGLVVKTAFYVLLRLWYDAFGGAAALPAGALLSALGAGAIVWGSAQALLTSRLKPLVAYSTVAQLGYLYLVFALAPPGSPAPDGRHGAVLFAISHACAKASLFLAAGSIQHVHGHDRIADLEGLGRLRLTFFSAALASVTLMGLPPSGAFAGKWLLLDAALAQGRVPLAIVIAGGGLLAGAYLFRILGRAFVPSAGEPPARVPSTMDWPAFLLALVALALGLASAPVLRLLAIGGAAGAVGGG